MGAAWALRKAIIPVVARRDVLNNLPLPLQTARVLELKMSILRRSAASWWRRSRVL
jgi:hypothetical protein